MIKQLKNQEVSASSRSFKMEDAETDLINKLKSGDDHAFNFLLKEYKVKVFNTCINMVQDEADAEDVAQEVFMEVYKSVPKFRGDSSLSTWIYRISVNKSLMHIRKKNRFKVLQPLSSISRDKEPSNFIHPSTQIEQKEQTLALYSAINTLPEQQKAAYVLHNFEDLSYQKVAQVLNKSLSSVESLIFRAKKNLEKKLLNYYKEK